MSSTSASSPPPAVIKADEESPTAAAVTVPSGGNSAEAALDDKAAITTDTTDSGFLRGKTFAQKLHTLLSITKYASIISWNVAGDVAIIHDVDAFNSTIMSVHFKKSKFGSFVRKLRRHGFSVISKQRSKSVTMMEFSSDYFLRDQPDLCHKMKDERKGQKQFSFLDPNVKIVIMNDGSVPITLLTPVVGGDGNIMGSPFGVGFHSSPSSSNMNVANYQVGCQQQLNTIGDGGFNAAANNGYLHINAYDNSKMSPMVSPPQNQQSFHNVMPMMNDNMMMPQQQQQQQQPPQLQHPLYGSSDAPSVQHQAPVGGGFAPSTPTPLFTYPPAPSEYPDLPQQLIGMQHNPQQQMEMQPNPQQQMFQSQQQHPQMMMTQHNLQQQQHQQLIQQNLQQMQQQMIRQSQQQQQHHSQQQMMQQMMQQNQQSLPPPPPAESGVSSGRDLATDFAAFIPIDECSNAKPSTAGVSNAVSFSNSEDSTERPPNNKVDLYSPKRQIHQF